MVRAALRRPACFAALLGTPEHGRFSIGPKDGVDRTTRRYRPGTMVLETEHETASGRVRVVDCLAMGHSRPLLVRLVEGLDGQVDMAVELIVRFDYGSIVPWVRRVDDRWRAIAGPDGLELCSPIRLQGRDLTSAAEFTVAAGEQVPFVLGWFPSHEPRRVPEDARALVEHTTTTWARWSARCEYSGEWREPVLRSLITLESLTFEPTGGIVAAATTSLPETLGGTRNWDYRYCWVRDATLTLEAFFIGGYQDEALRWREWLLRAVAGDPERLQTMYGVAGERRLTELELDWLPGYENSRPVRTGNGAHTQLQLDVYGELLDVLWQAARAGTPPSASSWSLARLLLDVLEKRWREPDEGIWEVRGERRHFTHSKVLSWVAFDRAVAMVEQAGYDGPADRWRAIRDEIHAEVCARGYDDRRGSFTQAYSSTALDASVLMIHSSGSFPATIRVCVRRSLPYAASSPTTASCSVTTRRIRPSTASASRKASSCRAASGWSRRSRSPASETTRARCSRACSGSRTTSDCSRRSTTRKRAGSSATSRRRSPISHWSEPRTRSHPSGRPSAGGDATRAAEAFGRARDCGRNVVT